jgi:hypothetical protein
VLKTAPWAGPSCLRGVCFSGISPAFFQLLFSDLQLWGEGEPSASPEGKPCLPAQMKDHLQHSVPTSVIDTRLISGSFMCLKAQTSRTWNYAVSSGKRNAYVISEHLLLPYLMKLHWGYLILNIPENKIVFNCP